MYGTIRHRFLTASGPNLAQYHFHVESAVTARLLATNRKPADTVAFRIRSRGAHTMASARYMKHSEV